MLDSHNLTIVEKLDVANPTFNRVHARRKRRSAPFIEDQRFGGRLCFH